MTLRARIDAALLALLAVAVLASVADITGLRPAAVLTAMLLVPGGALLTRMTVDEKLSAVGIAIGLSLAIDTVVATAAAVAQLWHPELLALLVGAAAAALLLHDLRNARLTGAVA